MMSQISSCEGRSGQRMVECIESVEERLQTMAQQNLPHATEAESEYSEMEIFWSMTPSAKLSSLLGTAMQNQ